MMKVLKKILDIGIVPFIKIVLLLVYQMIRRFNFILLSDNKNKQISAKSSLSQPVLFSGKGKIVIGRSQIGYRQSPGFLSGYSYIEARNQESNISIGNEVMINNNATIIADRSSITIGDKCLIGPDFSVFDSDFHGIDPEKRISGDHPSYPVRIGENVFIGSRVTILKGVKVGKNSIIGSGAVVVKDIPENSIASGNPAVVVKTLL